MQVMRLMLIGALKGEEIVQPGLGNVVGLTFEGGIATIYVEWDHEADPVGKLFRVLSPGDPIPEGSIFVAAAIDRGQFRMLYQVPYNKPKETPTMREMVALYQGDDESWLLRVEGREMTLSGTARRIVPATASNPALVEITIRALLER